MAFERIADGAALPQHLRGGVVAIGNFDGVHRGHMAVLDVALAQARSAGLPVLVLTFEPHPRIHFNPSASLFRLTPAPMKARLLAAAGFDAVVEQNFDHEFASLTAEEFVARILVEKLGVARAVAGFDFHFGKGRGGDPAFLEDAGKRHGFATTLVEAFGDEGGTVVSSSRIRDLLGKGELSEANGILGYRFTVAGTVAKGRQLGRTLGYPTANMALDPSLTLAHGIYAVRLRRADGSLHDGVASFGRRPTVEDDGVPLLETFVFDFSGDLYGEACEVAFFGFLRGEEKFDSLEALTVQMKRDEEEARALLSNVAPLGPLDAALNF